MKPTSKNTIFVTAITHRTRDFFTVMSTARKHDIYIHVLRTAGAFPDSWNMKVIPLYIYLKTQYLAGKEWFIFFDGYDVFFLKHCNDILERFSEVYDGRVIFNADYPRSLYPYTNNNEAYAQDELKSTWLIDYIQDGDTETSHLLNSGLYAGRIDHGIELIETAMRVQEDFRHRRLKVPFAHRLYEDLSVDKLLMDDQMAYWMTMVNYPGLFHVDSRKEFLSVAATRFMLDDDLESYRQTTRFRPLKDGTCIGDAVIVHAAGRWCGLEFAYHHNLYEPMASKE